MTTRGKIINIRNVDIIDGFLRKTAFAVKIGAARIVAGLVVGFEQRAHGGPREHVEEAVFDDLPGDAEGLVFEQGGQPEHVADVAHVHEFAAIFDFPDVLHAAASEEEQLLARPVALRPDFFTGGEHAHDRVGGQGGDRRLGEHGKRGEPAQRLGDSGGDDVVGVHGRLAVWRRDLGGEA